jgi:3-hydroxybutyrate dehydrogenase
MGSMLKGKSAIVTGATSGIGNAIASALAEEGCNIVFNGFGDSQEIEAFRGSLRSCHDTEVLYDKCDLTDPAQISKMIGDTVERFGRIDILVNNAGIQHVSPIDEFPTEAFQRIIDTNLAAPFYTIRGVLPIMKKNNWGRIVNISSVNGYVGSIHKGPYTAAKHGVLGLTKVVALETAETGITCNAVCPGFVKTAIVENQIRTRMEKQGLSYAEAEHEHLVEKHPSKKFIPAEDIASAVLYLCSQAAKHITGIGLPVDGGWLTV